MIFVGEHTSYTHAWIASAVESGVRGSVQLLLGKPFPERLKVSIESMADVLYHTELGLVDEAKEVVDTWMARWISVVSAPRSDRVLSQADPEQ